MKHIYIHNYSYRILFITSKFLPLIETAILTSFLLIKKEFYCTLEIVITLIFFFHYIYNV